MPPRIGTAALLRQCGKPAQRLAASPSLLPRMSLARRSVSSTSASPASNSNSSSSSTFSSVNPEEISHFNALAASWWDPHGSSRLLHLMNPLRHDFIRSCRASTARDEPSPNTNLRYLDIGCGGGIFAESAARLPNTSSVTAIDPSPEVLSVARTHARRDPSLQPPRLTYLPATIETLPVPQSTDEQYDVVSIFEVIEHVDSPAEFLKRSTPFVKPGGWLVGSTIARTWASWVTTNLVAEDILGIVPKGTHDWAKYINEDELKRWFPDSEWNSPQVMGVVYVPGMGWKEVAGSEKVGNYFFGFRRQA